LYNENIMASIELIKASDGSGNASVATVQTTRAPGASTIIVDTVQGINVAGFSGSMGTPHTFVDPITAETMTVISEATCVDFTGHVDGANLEIDTIAPGQTDLGSSADDIIVIRPTTQYADNVAETLEVAHEDDGQLKAGSANRAVQGPQGFLINGVIERTVASNNITVAIKTVAGANPSTTDPVYCRIGNTVRTITSALSVTKNAGTNWFGSGGSMFATQEIDYFVYLGYNTTDGVVIGFARIPYAIKYSDFSTTTTNEKYAAISTITTAAASDVYENIGRFNATLSATASFNWSIPATSIIINRPIFETRELTFVPTWSANGSMTFTTVTTGLAAYMVAGMECKFRAQGSGTTGGTANNGLLLTSPFTQKDISTTAGGAVNISSDSGASVSATMISTSTTLIGGRRYDAANCTLGAGRSININAAFRIV